MLFGRCQNLKIVFWCDHLLFAFVRQDLDGSKDVDWLLGNVFCDLRKQYCIFFSFFFFFVCQCMCSGFHYVALSPISQAKIPKILPGTLMLYQLGVYQLGVYSRFSW